MNLKSILIFTAGVGSGIGVGVLATKKYFEKKYAQECENTVNAEISKLREAYGASNMRENVGDISAPKELSEEKKKKYRGESKDPEKIEPMGRKKGDLDTHAVDYTSFYSSAGTRKTGTVTDISMEEMTAHPSEDDSEDEEESDEDCSDEEDEEEKRLELYSEEASKELNSGKPPQIIPEEEGDESNGYWPEYDRRTLFWWDEDKILSTDEPVEYDKGDIGYERIYDPERLIGDALTKYDFINDENQTVIWVKCPARGEIYEVQKMVGQSYYDSFGAR